MIAPVISLRSRSRIINERSQDVSRPIHIFKTLRCCLAEVSVTQKAYIPRWVIGMRCRMREPCYTDRVSRHSVCVAFGPANASWTLAPMACCSLISRHMPMACMVCQGPSSGLPPESSTFCCCSGIDIFVCMGMRKRGGSAREEFRVESGERGRGNL